MHNQIGSRDSKFKSEPNDSSSSFLTSTMVSNTVFKIRSDMASESSCVAAISATRSFLVTTFLSGGGGVENSRIVVEVVVLLAEEGADHDDADTWLPKDDFDDELEEAEAELEWVEVEVEVEVSSELITEPVVLLVAEPGNHDAQVRRAGCCTT